MSYNSRGYDAEDRYIDSTDDHTLRASDGDFFEQRSPPGSRHGANGGDDTGDVFLKIASEEAARSSELSNASDRPITVSKRKGKKKRKKAKEKQLFDFFFFFFLYSTIPKCKRV